MARLSEQGDGLEPAEGLLHPFAVRRLNPYPGWRVVRPSMALRSVCCAKCSVTSQRPQRRQEGARVVRLVGRQRRPGATNSPRRPAPRPHRVRVRRRGGEWPAGDQPVAVIHQDVSLVVQPSVLRGALESHEMESLGGFVVFATLEATLEPRPEIGWRSDARPTLGG
jgi:hypothetical protein